MGIVTAILKALAAAFNVFRQERALYNNPEMVKAKLAEQHQAARDAVNRADAVLANPSASPRAHKEALDDLRKAMS